MAKDPDNLAGSFETENTGGLLSGFLAEEEPFDRAIWAQWRCYWPFGGGLFTDLLVQQTTHLIAAMGVVAGRRTRQLRRLETSGNTERLRSLILHPMLQTPIRVRITVFLSILFLMVANDTAGASLGSVAIAIALGLLWSFSSRRSSDMRAVPAANAQNPG